MQLTSEWLAIYLVLKLHDLTRAVPTFEAHPKGGTGGLELDAGARVSAGPRGVLIIATGVSAFAVLFFLPSLSSLVDCLRGWFSEKKNGNGNCRPF